MNSEGQNRYTLQYQVSPIIFTGGIAASMPGGLLPIVSILQAQDYTSGVLSGDLSGLTPDDYFATFVPLPGATLADNDLGRYPFANQEVAANAIIQQPLTVSLAMICPVRQPSGYWSKVSVFQNLQSQIAKHSAAGGTYTVATPAYLYTNCVLRTLRDISDGDSAQRQHTWQWDFEQPLLTLAAAQEAQNSLMKKIGQGTALSGDPPKSSGQQPAVGLSSSLQGPSTLPAAQSLVGASVGDWDPRP